MPVRVKCENGVFDLEAYMEPFLTRIRELEYRVEDAEKRLGMHAKRITQTRTWFASHTHKPSVPRGERD